MHSPPFGALTHDTGGTVNNRSALGASMGGTNVRDSSFFRWRSAASGFVRQVAGALALLSLCTAASAQVTSAVGSTIQNVATVSFTTQDGNSVSINSNAVVATIEPAPTSSRVEILRSGFAANALQSTAGPTQCVSPQGVEYLPQPLLADGTVIDPTQPVTLTITSALHGGEAVFVQLLDPDQNRDAVSINTTDLQLTSPIGDRETVRLSETGPNTGSFVGYIQTRVRGATSGNCVLEVARNSEIASLYTDPFDSADASRASALVDPYGLIFDSRTGAPINGARVRLISA